MTKGQKLSKKRIHDPSLREYLDQVKKDVKIQDESDEDFLKQANKFYHHRNAKNGHGDLVEDFDGDDVTELPVLQHTHMQEFAFRYAMEPRSIAEWAKIFGISRHTVAAWLKRQDISTYVNLIRRHRFLRFSEKRMQIEELAFDQLKALLEYPTNDDIYESKRKLVMEIYSFDPAARRHLVAAITNSNVAADVERDHTRKMRRVGNDKKLLIDDKSEMDEIEDAIAIEMESDK